MLNIYLTNLAKYNEGELVGKWVELPRSEEELKADLKEVLGSDEEYFITDYESDCGIEVEEYSNLEDLNEKAEQLADMDEYDQEIFKALLENCSFDEALEVFERGDYMYYDGVTDDYDLGYRYAEETGLLYGAPEALKNYFDYEAFGRDLSFDGYYTDNGFMFKY